MTESRPTKIIIMADYGNAYAWDEDGLCTDIARYFPDIPEVVAIEKELEDWASWFEDADDNDPNFPWDKFHEKGRSLAVRLHQAIKHTGVEVYYDGPCEDPQKDRKPERIE